MLFAYGFGTGFVVCLVLWLMFGSRVEAEYERDKQFIEDELNKLK